MNERPASEVVRPAAEVVRREVAVPAPGRRPRRIRIPFLVDVVAVDDLQQMTELNDHRHVTRVAPEAGPLVNRFIARRVSRAFRIGTATLPTFTERGNAARAHRQQALESRLTREAEQFSGDAEALLPLADYVAGIGRGNDVGMLVQGLLGRLFDPAYRSTAETWAAAQLVSRFPRALPLRSWWWRWSGKLARSQRLLALAAKDDPVAIHATTVAVHNVVESLERLRVLATGAAPASAARAVVWSLVAPPALLRWCTRETDLAFLSAPLRPGTLVVLRLGRAQEAARDLATPFATGAWNQCPAHRYVPALLERVWTTARAARGK